MALLSRHCIYSSGRLSTRTPKTKRTTLSTAAFLIDWTGVPKVQKVPENTSTLLMCSKTLVQDTPAYISIKWMSSFRWVVIESERYFLLSMTTHRKQKVSFAHREIGESPEIYYVAVLLLILSNDAFLFRTINTKCRREPRGVSQSRYAKKSPKTSHRPELAVTEEVPVI